MADQQLDLDVLEKRRAIAWNMAPATYEEFIDLIGELRAAREEIARLDRERRSALDREWKLRAALEAQ